MAKQVLAVIVIAVMLSSAIGFALGSVSSPQSAGAAAGDSEVVTQLKKLNNKVKTLNRQTGLQQTSDGSVRGLLTIICDYTASISCKP